MCTALLLGNAVSASAAGRATPVPSPRTSAASSPVGNGNANGNGNGNGNSDWTVQDALRFWTSQRMDSATDPSGRTAPPPASVAPRVKRPTARTDGVHFAGVKSVGVLFSTDKDMKAHYCTASVVRSAGHDLILTAGHCLGSRAAFVPMYDHTKSAAAQPYGMWPVKEWFRDPQYASDKSSNSDLDYAFASLTDNGGRNVEDVVGGNTLVPTPGFVNQATVIGYPMIRYDTQDLAVRCSGVPTAAVPAYNQMQIDCGGMWGGVSGGPWFASFDPSGDTGQIIGNVGGFNAGGPDVPASDPRYNRITYSPLHGDRFFQLYDDAQHGLHADRGPYQQPPLPYSMGRGESWKHARLMAAGDFNGTGHSDLIAVRDDGTVTLYAGDGKGAFVSERQLRAPNTTWAHAASITAGDFTGSNRFDLMVRWTDGEVTLYGDVGANGLNNSGTRMIGPNPTWRRATQIVAGRFNAATYVTDLMVLWSDGKLTLYTNVSAGEFGPPHQLAAPNSVWRNATLLGSGEYSGGRKWDLMAKWPNGELDTYTGPTLSSVGTKVRVQNADGLGNAVMTTGDFTADHHTDDVVALRPNGETAMYTDTGADHLGSEVGLVPHG
ncbi:FG-GAP-like repeat-containing protein [Streptomyces sp. NPDC046197]|uniref:trypsin-like serine peptidase n=1 Tax=Streptomyces sp. NPDC046197 TaxID=3154337 RepID=UPI00340608D9